MSIHIYIHNNDNNNNNDKVNRITSINNNTINIKIQKL